MGCFVLCIGYVDYGIFVVSVIFEWCGLDDVYYVGRFIERCRCRDWYYWVMWCFMLW